jgi:hypothetical protein
VKDPDYYDRRYEKKNMKNGMKQKLRREFPVSTNTTTTALLLILHLLLYSTLVLLLLLLLLVLLLYSLLVVLLLLLIVYYICSNDCVLYIVLCTKQPYGLVLCGFYICKYLRTCSRFSSSWRQLKKAQGWWKREKVDQDFRQTVADICKFVTESAHEGNTFFN